jgi:endonuclease YncB( thermonuclease family)
MAHDFKRFPELTNSQAELYYWDSPHRQIFEDFHARVVKVTDGDTIRVSVDFRDFDFPIRFLDIDAPEINEPNGEKVKRYLESRILGKTIDVDMNPKNRVDRWGRLLGKISEGGIDMGDDMLRQGMVTRFDQREEGEIPAI